MAHVGDAVVGHRIRRDVLLDPDAARSELRHSGADVGNPECRLGLRVGRADRAPREHEPRAIACLIHEPGVVLVDVLPEQPQSEQVAVEVPARLEIMDPRKVLARSPLLRLASEGAGLAMMPYRLRIH